MGLLAIAVCQSMQLLTVTPLSRVGSLLHFFALGFVKSQAIKNRP
ncbi:hypothetical protein EMIT0P395_50245 [Pseudomonas sp. IT-P395]